MPRFVSSLASHGIIHMVVSFERAFMEALLEAGSAVVAYIQVASYELGKLLPEEQRPLPMHLLRIGDSRSDLVPNGGKLHPPACHL